MLRVNRLVYILTFFIPTLTGFTGTQNILQSSNFGPISSNPLDRGEREVNTSSVDWHLKKQFFRSIILLLIYFLVLWRCDYLFSV
jgi:hypothetical protein